MRFRIQRQRWTTIDYKLYLMSLPSGSVEIIPLPKLTYAEQDILADAGLFQWRNKQQSEATMIVKRKELAQALNAIAAVLTAAGYDLNPSLQNNRVWVTDDDVQVHRPTMQRTWKATHRSRYGHQVQTINSYPTRAAAVMALRAGQLVALND